MPCLHIYQRGVRKGTQCGTNPYKGNAYCNRHSAKYRAYMIKYMRCYNMHYNAIPKSYDGSE